MLALFSGGGIGHKVLRPHLQTFRDDLKKAFGSPDTDRTTDGDEVAEEDAVEEPWDDEDDEDNVESEEDDMEVTDAEEPEDSSDEELWEDTDDDGADSDNDCDVEYNDDIEEEEGGHGYSTL
jgi:hypothetical protein